VTRLQFFESGSGLIAVRLGMMSPAFLERYDMYKTYDAYHEKFKDLGFRQSLIMARKKTQEAYNCSYHTLRRVIIFFEEGQVLQISVNNHAK
jgi:hypothetical protein